MNYDPAYLNVFNKIVTSWTGGQRFKIRIHIYQFLRYKM